VSDAKSTPGGFIPLGLIPRSLASAGTAVGPCWRAMGAVGGLFLQSDGGDYWADVWRRRRLRGIQGWASLDRPDPLRVIVFVENGQYDRRFTGGWVAGVFWFLSQRRAIRAPDAWSHFDVLGDPGPLRGGGGMGDLDLPP